MTQEIYLDGNLMDLDETTKITLQIKSNLFTEISKCVGNRTYTVQLPKTARNMRIIEYANQPAANTDIPYQYMAARYVRNGIEIFTDGYAYIISVKEKIEVCIVWGIPVRLRSIFADGIKLNEIPDDGRVATYVRYNEVDEYANLSDLQAQGWCYAAIDFLAYDRIRPSVSPYDTDVAAQRMPKMGYLRPSVFLSYILNRLWTLYGIDFNVPADISEWLSRVIFPCVTDNVDETLAQRMYTANDMAWEVQEKSSAVFPDSINEDVYIVPTVHPICDVDMEVNYSIVYKIRCEEGTLRRVFRDNLIGAYAMIDGGVAVGFTPATNFHAYDENGQPFDPEGTGTRTQTWEINSSGMLSHVEASAKDTVTIQFSHDNTTIRTFYGEIKSGTCSFNPTIKSAIYGVDFPLTKNFPDIKVTDFLQWVAAITGTFPRQTENAGVEFVRYEAIFENQQNAVDWSSKLVKAYDEDVPREIGFTVEGWAQNNNYLYGNSDDVGDFADGQIHIDNVQLDEEQDVIGEDFNAAKPSNNIPIYQVAGDADEAKLLEYLFPAEDKTDDPLTASNTDPYVLIAQPMYVVTTAYVSGQFDSSLYWSYILNSSRYKGVIASLRKAKVLHEVFALTELDIKTFDETVPVYLAQYGHYYAVTEIKTAESGIAEVTLLQLEF